MLIEVVNCVIDGKVSGEQLEVNKKQGEHLVSIGYAKEIVKAEKPAKPQAEVVVTEKPAPKVKQKK